MKTDKRADGATAAELERLELLLMNPEVRRDRDRVAALLTDDFVEFGSSGRVWTRDSTLNLLGTETYTPPEVEDFACRMLSLKLVLATYRAVRKDATTGERTVTLRSSLWTKETGTWKMCFHQGTRAS
jgi:hypothetical protein